MEHWKQSSGTQNGILWEVTFLSKQRLREVRELPTVGISLLIIEKGDAVEESFLEPMSQFEIARW